MKFWGKLYNGDYTQSLFNIWIPKRFQASNFLPVAFDSSHDNDDLSFVSQSLILDFSDEVGMDFGNPLTLNFTETCLDTIVSLELTFDAYAEECVWEIYDLSGTPTVVETGGSGSEYDDLDNSTISFDFCLPSGNYGIVVYDLYGDGGTSYTVTSGGATLASGSTPDAGGGYPVTTQDSATYTVN